jgi:hypothetical protein
MSNNYAPQTLSVLRTISVSGIVTSAELKSMLPHVQDMSGVISNLQTHHLINSEKIDNKPTLYSISGAGRRVLSRHDKPQGNKPSPREPRKFEPYSGERPMAMRDGADDFLKIPSLGDTERKRPIIIGGRVSV